MHLVFRRLHSQQDRVPLRILRLLPDVSEVWTAVAGSSSDGFNMSERHTRVPMLVYNDPNHFNTISDTAEVVNMRDFQSLLAMT